MTARRADNAPPKYATKVAYPRHLYAAAVENAQLVSRVTIDAYNFIFSRCNKNLQITAVVAIGLAAITQEYESGEHQTLDEFNLQGAAKREGGKVYGADGKREIDIAMPDEMHDALQAAPPGRAQAIVSEIGALIEEACGGDKMLAAGIACVLSHTFYFGEAESNRREGKE
jgi:hypothetical protein